MKKLEAINFDQCDILSHNQLATVMGGLADTRTHQSVENELSTDSSGNTMVIYTITWDCGSISTGMWCLSAVDPE